MPVADRPATNDSRASGQERASPAGPTPVGAASPEGGAALPGQARVVIVGGGVIGCSVAYHLAKRGCTDVVLLERDRLTSGTTWHAAGLICTFGSTSETFTELRRYTRDLYTRLPGETGQATGFRPVGFIELATSPDRLHEFRRVAAFNRLCGVEVEEISATEVQALFPFARTDDVLAGFHVAGDGRANPVDVTMALAKGARQAGVRIFEGIPATGILRQGDTVIGVDTPMGPIRAETVINCAGMWARQLGEDHGVAIPLQAAEHYYLITDRLEGISADWPVLEDPASFGYFQEEGGGLMIGLFEAESAPWRIEGVPKDFSFGELAPDWERMTPYLQAAMARVPASLNAGIRNFFCGPESFTPDLRPLVGEAPELRNYFVAAGMNSVGILTAGGIGRVVADWVLDGRPAVDVTGMNIDRLQPFQANPRYRAARTTEALGWVYAPHYPYRKAHSARGARRTPLHDRLAALGASFREISGWESPDWFGPPGEPADPGPLGWGRPAWFDRWAAEHRAARESVALFDLSFMARFLVQGPEAARGLEWLSANRVSGQPGRITYTPWLDERGGLQADLTVTQLAEDRFWVLATDTAHRHVETWMRRRLAPRLAPCVVDLTSAYALLSVQGPQARTLLQSLTSVDLSDRVFPFRTAREIDLGLARAICIRITYVGELGYELHVPADQALHVYELVLEAGRAFGLVHAGLRALSSLRLEKGYRDYGHDLDNTDTVLAAGLGFAVAWDKPGGFLGREAALAERDGGKVCRRLVHVRLLDSGPMLYHAEPLLRDGVAVGYLRSAAYGHTLAAAVGLAMVDATLGGKAEEITPEWLAAGQWTVSIAQELYPAEVSLRPFYDPRGERVRPA